MSRDNGHSSLTVMLSFLLGGVAGAVTALLLAPESGEETRRRISDFKDDVKDKTSEYIHETRERVDDVVEKGKDYVHDAREKAEEAYEKGKDYVEKKKSVISSAMEAGKEAYRKEKDAKSS